jgi:kinesin family protein 6/9
MANTITAETENAISIFLRIRPVPRPSPRIAVDLVENEVEFTIPKLVTAG